MAYNFAVSGSKVKSVAEKFGDIQEILEGNISDIYAAIDGLSEYWSGDSYDVFRAKCLEYRPALDALPVMMQAFHNIYHNKVVEASNDLQDDLGKAFGRFDKE